MRTLNEISEYTFTIKYRPGKENCAADTLSRLDHEVIEDCEVYNNNPPAGFRLLDKVEGGGDSFFQSIMLVIDNDECDG